MPLVDVSEDDNIPAEQEKSNQITGSNKIDRE